MTARDRSGTLKKWVRQRVFDHWLALLTILLIIFVIPPIIYYAYTNYGINEARLVASALTPIVVVALGYAFNRQLQQYRTEWERRRRELERRDVSRVEFTVDTNIHGPKKEYYLVEFLIYAHNKGYVRHDFTDIILTVRGHKKRHQPTIWRQSEHKLAFPHEAFKIDIVQEAFNTDRAASGVDGEGEEAEPEDEGSAGVTLERRGGDDAGMTKSARDTTRNSWFVEPDVKQMFTYISRIPADYHYMLVKAEFTYESEQLKPHTVERMFDMNPSGEPEPSGRTDSIP